jgi:hypothetical protein
MKDMSKKNKATFTVSNNAVGITTPQMDVCVKEVPPDKWLTVFKVRGVTVEIKTNTEDRDEALVECAMRVHDLMKEPFGIRFKGMVRI